jgi:27-O-demethylrifamycin SV methyltransferase
MPIAQRPDPASHYDLVTDAWQYLLGEDLHYGYFAGADRSLSEATNALTQLLAQNTALKPGLNVLDVGCGTGNPALMLARDYQASVLGISTSEIGIDRAKARALRENIDHLVRFELRDGTATGLDAESFDRVWVMESSHLMPRKDLLLKESFRVLRPGGRLVLCDIVLLRSVPFSELLTLQRDITILDQVFGRANMAQLSQYARWAKEAGFQNILETDISRETMLTFERWRANVESNASIVSELIGPDGLNQFRKACDILSKFWLDWLGYGLLVAERAG